MKLMGVYGASGCGRGVMPLLRMQLEGVSRTDLVFVDDSLHGREVNGHAVLSWPDFVSMPGADKYICIAVADPGIRETIASRVREAQIKILTVRAQNAVFMDNVAIGEGAIISPFVTLTSNVRIGCFFHANIYAYVEHDCLIGDFVTFAPGAQCNGNIVIGDRAYIGSGALLRQGKPGNPLVIGRDAVVGMGAVVTKNVPDGATVVGNPARTLDKDA